MLAGTENSVSLPLLSVSVDGQKWQTELFSVHQGRKITPSYSRCGLTIAFYSKTKELMSKCIKFLLLIPKIPSASDFTHNIRKKYAKKNTF